MAVDVRTGSGARDSTCGNGTSENMIRSKIAVNMDGFNRKIAGLKQNTPKATATALTRTAQYAARKEEDETRRVFNAPTTYTQRAFFTQWATAGNLQARV